MIAVGSRIPDFDFQMMTEESPSNISTDDVFAGKNVVLFGIPGAFTPSCYQLHLPSYIQEYDTLKNAGIDTIACTAVNNIFVLDIWARATGADQKILFLADGSAEFAAAMGLLLDARKMGFGFARADMLRGRAIVGPGHQCRRRSDRCRSHHSV
jgi:peroxiredoxin